VSVFAFKVPCDSTGAFQRSRYIWQHCRK